MDLVIRRARIWGRDGLWDVAVAGGRYAEIARAATARGAREVEAGGRLLAPAFIDPHIHLDKVLVAEDVRPNRSGTLREAIEILWERKAAYTVEEIVRRAGQVIESAVLTGTTRIRTHVDVDTIGKLRPLEGVVAARERYRDLVDLQIVAFPQEGIVRDPGTADFLAEAVEAGADLVGGMPHNEASPADSRRHIEICFEIATRHDRDIDMHVDETDDPSSRTLEILADLTLAHGYQGRVTAGHTCALAAYPDDYARRVIDKLARAGVHMITNPATNLMLQGRLDRQPVRRGITRVKELLEAGVNVAMGQDCVKDTFYPFGRADMLEVALITAHAAHMSLPHEVETVFAMATTRAARVLRIPDHAVETGARADCVLLDAPTAAEAIRLQAPRRLVVRHGRVVAETTTEQRLHRGAAPASS
ncbi:MAG: amidohydrolase family protein [Candidatus Rokubacteria bacterium]|nr:amidohydrolase family protein [Candidatus Rokubacteria bacterium]